MREAWRHEQRGAADACKHGDSHIHGSVAGSKRGGGDPEGASCRAYAVMSHRSSSADMGMHTDTVLE